jgi:hypothetical protein
VLAAQFTFAFQPGSEHPFFEYVHHRHAERNILMPFGFIIAINAFQGVVELIDETRDMVRLFLELDQPFMSAIALVAEVDRSCRVVIDHGSGALTGNRHCLIRVVHDHFFPERIDEMFQTPAYPDPERRETGELYGIPQQVSP